MLPLVMLDFPVESKLWDSRCIDVSLISRWNEVRERRIHKCHCSRENASDLLAIWLSGTQSFSGEANRHLEEGGVYCHVHRVVPDEKERKHLLVAIDRRMVTERTALFGMLKYSFPWKALNRARSAQQEMTRDQLVLQVAGALQPLWIQLSNEERSQLQTIFHDALDSEFVDPAVGEPVDESRMIIVDYDVVDLPVGVVARAIAPGIMRSGRVLLQAQITVSR